MRGICNLPWQTNNVKSNNYLTLFLRTNTQLALPLTSAFVEQSSSNSATVVSRYQTVFLYCSLQDEDLIVLKIDLVYAAGRVKGPCAAVQRREVRRPAAAAPVRPALEHWLALSIPTSTCRWDSQSRRVLGQSPKTMAAGNRDRKRDPAFSSTYRGPLPPIARFHSTVPHSILTDGPPPPATAH